MKIEKNEIPSRSIKITLHENGTEIARTFLYLIQNDLHPDQPYALIEDVFVQEEHRGKGIGSQMVQAAIKEAKKQRCYKIICTSRHGKEEVHKLYQKHGFKNHGIEFRMDLE